MTPQTDGQWRIDGKEPEINLYYTLGQFDTIRLATVPTKLEAMVLRHGIERIIGHVREEERKRG